MRIEQFGDKGAECNPLRSNPKQAEVCSRLSFAVCRQLCLLTLSVLVLGATSRVRADLPPLASYDDSLWPAGGPPTQQRYDDINLFTRTLHGSTYQVGPVELRYEESYGTTNQGYNADRVGNFDVMSFSFHTGLTIQLPYVYAGSLLIDGGQWLRFGPVQQSDYEEQGQTYSFRTLEKNGRYVLMRPDTLEPELHDTSLALSYSLSRLPSDPSSMLPVSVKASTGEVVTITWDAAHSNPWRQLPQELTLSKAGTTIERVSFVWNTGASPVRLNQIQDSIGGTQAIYRWVTFDYRTTAFAPGVVLAGAYAGASLSGALATGLVPTGLRFAYTPAGEKDALTRISNYQGKQLKEFLLTTAQLSPYGVPRTVYSGVRYGSSAQLPITLSYPMVWPGTPRQATVTEPQRSGLQTMFTLDVSDGSLTQIDSSACPQPVYQTVKYPDGLLEGMLSQEIIRDRCSDTLTRTYSYTDDGFVSGIDIAATGSDGTVQHSTVSYQSRRQRDLNGVRRFVATSHVDATGTQETLTYDTHGRILSIASTEPGESQTYRYSFWGGDAQQLQAIEVTSADGRVDRSEFDQTGLLQSTRVAYGTPVESAESWTYDNLRRARTKTDGRGVTYRTNYEPNGRVASAEAWSGSEHFTTSFSYHLEFPELVSRISDAHSIGGNSEDNYTLFTFFQDLPLVTKIESGGTGVATQIELERVFDPGTLRLVRECERKSPGSTQGCEEYRYRSDGLYSGLLDYVDSGGGILQGGTRKTFRYDTFGEYAGSNFDDGVMSLSRQELLDGFGRPREVLSYPERGSAGTTELLRYHYDTSGRKVRQEKYIDGALVSDLLQTFADEGRSDRASSLVDAVSGYRVDYNYDAIGRVRSVTESTAGGGVVSALQIPQGSYDLFGRAAVQSIYADGAGWRTIQNNFNARGELAAATDERGNTTYFSYDAFSRPVAIASDLYQVDFNYRIRGGQAQTVKTTTELTNDPDLQTPQTETMTYDALGRIVGFDTEPRGASWIYSYNQRGFMNNASGTFADAPGMWLSYSYDAFGRNTATYLNDGLLMGRTYTGGGLVQEMHDGRGGSTSYTYDGRGRLTRTQFADGSTQSYSTPIYFATPQANGARSRVQLTDRDSSRTTIDLDAYGHTLSLHRVAGGLGAFDQSFVYQGLRLAGVSTTSSEGTTTSEFSYDLYGRPSLERTVVSSPLFNSVFSLGKSYDNLGRLITYSYPTNPETQVDYVRDGFGRISQVLRNGQGIAQYSYDGPVLTGMTLGDVSRSFEYDRTTGNLSRILDQHGTQTIDDLRFSYDAAQRLRRREDFGVRRGTQSSALEQFTFNVQGALSYYQYSLPLVGSATISYAPSAHGVLGAVSAIPNEMYELPSYFDYDALGNPRQHFATGARFFWDPLGLKQLNQGGERTDFLHDGFGRHVWYGANTAAGPTSNRQVRDRGMVLTQEEVR